MAGRTAAAQLVAPGEIEGWWAQKPPRCSRGPGTGQVHARGSTGPSTGPLPFTGPLRPPAGSEQGGEALEAHN